MKTKSRSKKAIIGIALAAVIIASVFTVMFSAAQGVRISNVATDKVQTGDGLVTADLDSGLTATDLANSLMGGGITVTNVVHTGANVAAGTFSGGTGIIGFESGIILSTGNISSVVGPNVDDGTTTINDMPGDADLDALIPGYTTHDATVLEFDFVPTSNVVTFEYVFGSEEYNEYVHSSFNDVFGFFINGVNCALIPGTWIVTPVAINNVNGGNPFGTNANNSEFYRNNDLSDGGGSIDTELDGLTVVLSVTTTVNPGVTNHIKLAIADTSDYILDSDVFIKTESFVAHNLVLTPLSSTGPVGSSHTLTATLTDEAGYGILGETITFNITEGPHAGLTDTDVTDANGQATWSYTGTTADTDTIVATGATETSNNAFKTWESSVFVDVLSVDAGEFPKIWAHVYVNTSAGKAGELTESNFEIYEDGVKQTIESFNVTGSGVTTAYHIDYTTTNPTEDCTDRTVKVVVHDPIGEDSDTGKYIAPCEVSGNEVYFVPQSSGASYGSEKEVQIWVNATNVGGGQINLTYDPTCANVTNWVRGAALPMGTWTHSAGGEWITFTAPMGFSLTGEYLIGTLTIQCVCEDECSTTLDFVNPSKLFDPYGSEIPGVTWTDGAFECGTFGICGDVAPYPGGDEVVNMGDVIRLLNHVGNPTEFPVDSWAGDCKCTGDGTINMGDVILLLNHVGNPTEFPLECC